MKKTKITRSMCVFLAAAMLPLDAIVSLAAETAHIAFWGKSNEEVVQTSEKVDIESVVPDSLDLICESETDTTATLSWSNMFADSNGTYDIYVDSVLIQEDVTETTYTLTDLEAANEYNISVKAVNQDGEVTETSNDVSVITDLVITNDTALWEETTVGNLYINSGTLNLNEQALHVNGNVIVSKGTFKINGGTVDISGDLRIQTENTDSNGNVSYSDSYGYLDMTNENDYVKVGKDFVTYSRYSHNGYLTEGTLEVKGDFTQISGNGSNYYASGNHRTILSGDKLQTVAGSSTNMHFAVLELQNFSEEGIHFNQAINANNFVRNGCNVSFENSGVLGWKLEDDEEYNGDLNFIGDTLDLNGHKLTVNGDLTQSGGEVKINGGELIVTGDYKLQTAGNGASSGKLNMTNEADKVTIGGTFATRSTVDHTNLLKAGTMTIGGDLYQYGNSYYNFKTSGTHKVVLNGTKKQTVSFESWDDGNCARFNILEITNTSEEGVTFATEIWVQTKLYDTDSVIKNSIYIYLSGPGILADNSWSHDLRINQNKTLESDWNIRGSLYLSGGTFYLNRHRLNVRENVVIYDGTLCLNGGQLEIGKDLRFQGWRLQNDGTVLIDGISYGYLKMVNENDFIKVNRDFITYADYSRNGYLTNGILEIKGNFTQMSGYSNNFFATGDHKVVLSGAEKQTISLANPYSRFANLEITNTSEDGVYVSSYFNADKVIDENSKLEFADGRKTGWTLEKDETVESFDLIYGTLDLNGHKLTVDGDLTQSGGEVKINSGELIVTGDYKLQTAGNGASSGKLNMTNEADKVTIGGTFATRSNVDHTKLLTAGTMTIGGDLHQYNVNIYNFNTSGTHKIVLNGKGSQDISFEYSDYNSSGINILEITNKSDEGLTLKTEVCIKTKLYNTDSIVNNSRYFYLSRTGILSDNTWSYDLTIKNMTRTLDSDWYIEGSLYLYDGLLDLNSHRINVNGDVAIYNNTLYINGGQLNVGKNLKIEAWNWKSDGTVSSGGKSYGHLKMVNENDLVKVNGNFIIHSEYSHNEYLTNGILEVKGNFTQILGNESNFYATGNHKVVLSGTEKQSISLASPNARFANIEIINTSDDGVYVSSYFNADKVIDENSKLEFADGRKTGWTLEKDETVEGFDLIYGTLDLNGYKLTVNGDLTQSGGEVKINGGELIVTGDYKLQTSGNGASSGKLNMTNEADKVTIGGTFATRSTVDHTNLLKAGTMTIGGDLYQYGNSDYNFKTSGTHKVVLNGTKKQTVSFANVSNESYARFNILEITNTSEEGVTFATDVWVQTKLYDTESVIKNSGYIYLSGTGTLADNTWSYDLNVNQNKILDSDWKIDGTLCVRGGEFNLNGHKLEIGNDVALGNSYAVMYVNNGQLYVGRDLRIQESWLQNDGTIAYGVYSYAKLSMTKENDFVKVNRNFVMYSQESHSGYLTNGILEVKGNFSQIFENGNNFYATGEHKVLLSGIEKQTINFASPNVRFANLEITNTSEDGVYVSSYFNADKVIDENGKLEFADGRKTGWTLEKDETLEGFDLIYGTLDLNGHKLTVDGDLTQSGGEVKINGGELIVTGDYKLQTAGNGASSGKLNMTNETDKVTISGTFATRSTVDHTNLLKAGTMTIGGDLYQDGNSYYNFKTSGTHKVVLSGTEKQTVSFTNVNNESHARFNILEITNTAEEGVTFATDVWVQTKLYNTESVIKNSGHIYLSGAGTLADNTWSYDLSINQNKTLDSDWKIDGTLRIRNGTFNLNGHKLEVGNDVALGYSYAVMYVNNGQLYVGRDLRIQESWLQNDGTIAYGVYSYAKLKMTEANDFVKVNRNFITHSKYSHNGYLTNGILEIKGNFTQISGDGYNFYATGEHKVVLSGTKQQKINFASTNSKFNILEINKPMDTGYVFNRTPVWNELIETAMDTQAPTAPKNLKSDLQTVTSVSLKWSESTDNNAVAGYDVYRNGVRVGSTDKTEFIDDRLKSNTSYTYYVIAYDSMHNESDWSNIIEVKTLPDENAPTQPTELKVKSQTSSSVVLNWSASTDNSKVEGYDVYRNNILIGTVNGTSFTDNSIASGLYVYYVKAFDDTDNYSEASETLTVDTEAPASPVLEIESSTNTQTVISWNCTDNVGVEKYEIFRNGQKIVSVTENTYTDKNLKYDENYEYYVIAYDKAKNASEKSNTVSVYTGEDTEAPKITGIYPNANTFAQSIPLTIYARDNASVASITIEVSADGEDWKTVDAVSANGIANTSVKYELDISEYADGSLYVRAKAKDAKNNESDTAQSPVIKYTVDNTAPDKLTNVNASVVNGQLEIKWNDPADKDVNYFRIYKAYSGDKTFTLLKDKLEALNYFDTDIELSEMYDYYVTAVDYAGNESKRSEIVSGGISEDKVNPQILSVVPKTGTKICSGRTMSISCKDNFRLGSILVEFAPKGTELWETMYTQNLSKNAEIVKFDLDMNNMADGIYDVRVQVTDKSGNKSKYYTCSYDYKSCSIAAPKLFATERGWQIKLNWSSTTDSSLLGYNLYKRSSEDKSFVLVGSTILNEYTDNNVKAGQTYFYYVEAIDSYNNVVSSEKVMAVPTDEDTVDPVADAGIDLYGLAGMSIQFDGSKSSDNHYIESYQWDFGDGETANSAKTNHTYSDSGVYTATLTVKDSAGNTSSSEISVTVHDEETHGYAEVQIVDSSSNRSLSDATVYAELPDGDVLVNTNSNGVAVIYAPFGTYKMSFYKKEYLPTTADITVEKGGSRTTVYIENGKLVTGKIDVERLDLQEIENLGIDTSAPENQYVYNYHVNIKTDDPANPRKFLITVNGEGELVNTDTYFDFNGVKFAILNMNTDHVQYVGLIPSTVPGEPPSIVLLDVSTKFTWLKEFFNVSLTVQNNASREFYIGNSSAEIKLPKGMSLAKTSTDNSAARNMGTIYGGETSTVSWIVRGDTAGEYNIFADFSGILAPFNTEVNTQFTTDKPVKVYGGDALKLTVDQEYYDDRDECWRADFTLTNISDETIHNLKIDYSAYTEFLEISDMTVIYPDGSVQTILWKEGKPDYENIEGFLPAFNRNQESGTKPVDLKPGESINGYYTAKK